MGFWRDTGVYLGLVEPRSSEVPETRATTSTGVTPPARPTIEEVTPEAALGIGAVYRAISIIVTSVAQMQLGVYRDGIEIKPSPLIKQPNINDTATAFIEETVFSLAAHGNAYWRLYRSDASSPVQSIEVLDPGAVTVTWEERNGQRTGKRLYAYGNTELKPYQIKHLKLMRRPGQILGTGPIQSAKSELKSAIRLRNFADQWFDTSGVPTGVLTTDLVLNDTESAAFAEAWKEFIKQHGGTAVLSQGLHYEALHLKPAEAQFLEVQQAMVVNIARLFGVPAMHLLAELSGTSNTYLNLEQANIVFLQTTLTRYMTEIENALTDLLPRGQKVAFKEESLLRMDSIAKWNVRKIQNEIGYTSGAELRAIEGKEPLPEKSGDDDA